MAVPVAATVAVGDGGSAEVVAAALAVLAAEAAVWFVASGRDGFAFTSTAVAFGAVGGCVFVTLYPGVLVSTLGAGNDLTGRRDRVLAVHLDGW